MEFPVTDRQKEILERVVSQYISLAQPISSQLLDRVYQWGISQATIRNELQALEEEGFLLQPHTSAGRIPTDKGYRFFVDEIFGRESDEQTQETLRYEENWIRDQKDWFTLMLNIARRLARGSSNLAVLSLGQKEMWWKEGWEELLQEPEFQSKKHIIEFVEFLHDFEQKAMRLFAARGVSKKLRIYIGGENPFSRIDGFSIIIGECGVFTHQGALIAILGPKRMAYPKNISLMNVVMNLWKRRPTEITQERQRKI